MKNQRILVVESSPPAAMALRLAFERAGYFIQCVRSATGIRAAVERECPLAVLVSLDLASLPSIFAELRFGEASVPVIGMGNLDAKPFGAHLDATVPKPVDARALVGIVERALASHGDTRARSTRVLLVDDDDLQRKLVGLQLTDAGFRVHSVRDGHDALTYARSERPDIVLSDILMPGIDGFSLCAAIRADPTLSDIPVVLATATFVNDSDQALATEVGASASVVRDPRGQAIVEALEGALASRRQPASTLDPKSEKLVERRRSRQTELMLERGRLVAHLATTKAALAMLDAVLESVVHGGELEAQLEEILVSSLGALGSAHGAIWLGSSFEQPAVRVGWPSAAEATAWTDAARNAVSSAGACGTSLPLAGEPAFFATAPIHGRGLVLGALVLAKPSDAFDDAEWIGFARSLGLQLGQALELRGALQRAEAAERRANNRASNCELIARVNLALATEESLDGAIGVCRDAIEASLDGIAQVWTLDSSGAFRTRGGPNHLAGTSQERLAPDHPVVATVLQRMVTTIDDIATDARVREKAFFAEHRLVSARVYPLVVEGRVTGMVGVASRRVIGAEEASTLGSIADAIAVGIGRKRSELESSQLRGQLVSAQRLEAVAQLAGGIAHDFNNMLAVVMSCAEILGCEVEQDPSKMELVDEIRQASARSATLTRQLLAFSRTQVLRTEPAAMNEVVKDVSKMLGRLIGEHVELEISLEEDAGMVVIDRGQVEQVLVNLVVNARDAMPNGGRIRVSTGREADDVFVRVEDSGSGMEPSVLERIFEPFFTTKENGKGTGLGLAMVHGITTQLGGKVRVTSEIGKGSAFTVSFPASKESSSAVPASATMAVARGSESILLVEDDVFVRRSVCRTLEKAGYKILAAEDPQHALEIAKTERVDLLLTDVVMPGRSGPELARELAGMLPSLHILLMSGHCDEILAPMLDGKKVLQKPFEPKELCSVVRETLDRSAA